MPVYQQVLVLLCAYLLGGVSFGYLLVKWAGRGDVRTVGSGSTGATNAGRVLGKKGFFWVCILDGAKGFLMVWIARWVEVPLWCVWGTGVAVVVGHVWPAMMGFRGGKGVAPVVGCWLALAPWVMVPVVLVLLIAYWMVRRFSIAGLFGLVVLPFGSWYWGGELGGVAGAVVLLVILFAHRENIRDWRRSFRTTSP